MTESGVKIAKPILYQFRVLSGNESALLTEALERRPWWGPAKENGSWNLWWGGNGQKFTEFSTISGGSKSRQVFNRLENHREVCTKSGLAANLAQLQRKGGPDGCPWIPETYVLEAPAGGDVAAFKKAFQKHAQACTGTTWIVKPTSSNRGNGIEVLRGLPDILAHVKGKSPGTKCVVQKYIDEPLLVEGRKFDLRAYVLVAPNRSVHLYREAYVRTSSTPYQLDDLSDRAAHLTNDAVQKKLDSYTQVDDHCKMRLEELQAAVGNSVDIQGAVWPQMRACVRQLFAHVVDKLNPRNLSHSFELLGLDFMIDAQGQLLLIEVNTSPALFRVGAYLTDLLPRVIEEVMQKAVDSVLPPPPGCSPDPLNGFEKLDLRMGAICPGEERQRKGGCGAVEAGGIAAAPEAAAQETKLKQSPSGRSMGLWR